MFFVKDEWVFKVCFVVFEGEWVYCKLGEIIEFFFGGIFIVGKFEYYGGDILFICLGEILFDLIELFIIENGLNSLLVKMVKVGDIFYVLYGVISGEVGIFKIIGVIN